MVGRLVLFIKRNWLLINDPRTPFKTKLVVFKKLINLKIKKFKRLRIVIKPKPPRFSGWGMTSDKFMPWDPKSNDDIGLEFAEANELLLNKIQKQKFTLSQMMTDGQYSVTPSNILSQLSWRHYIIYWSVRYATQFNATSNFNIVEAGVCDGLTINFAISAAQCTLDQSSNFKAFLYDAWEGMKEENLTSSEKSSKGNYSYLSVEQTKSNLSDFQDRCKFIKGHIPEVFFENPGPTELSWLHIDLNSSMPTLKTLEQFVPKLLPGGVVLFDDYAHGGFSETRKVADDYCNQVNGLLFPLPTGQAIFFKR